MLELFKVMGSIDINGVKDAEKDLDSVDKKSKGFASKLGGVAKTVGKAGALIGGATAAAGVAAFGMANKVSGAFDDISKGAQRVGISSDAFQELDYWASQNGMSHENMEKAVGRFNQRLGQGLNGNEKYSDALKKMGINMDDVRDGTLSTEDAFAQSIQKLSEMESEQDKVALATEMFGTRLSREMLPALQDGALGIDEARKKAQELGIVIGEDSLKSGVAFADTWDSLKRAMGAVGMQIGAQIIPIFQKMMDWVLEHMPQIQATFKTVFDAIGLIFNAGKQWIQEFIGVVQEWFSNNEGTLSKIWESYKVYLSLVWDYVQFIFSTIKNLVTEIMSYLAPFIRESLAKIQKFWSENGQQIMQAVQNAFSFIKKTIEFVMPIVTRIIRLGMDLVKNLIENGLDVVMGIIKVFTGLFTGDFSKMKDGIVQIFGGLFDYIKGFFRTVKSFFYDAGKGLIDQWVKGITSMASRVTDTISNIAGKVRNFLPFSPAKVGPLADLDKLDFEGPITDSIQKGERNIQSKMAGLLNMPDVNMNVGSRSTAAQTQTAPQMAAGGFGVEMLTLLRSIENSVKKGHIIAIDGEQLTNKVNTNNAIANAVNYF